MCKVIKSALAYIRVFLDYAIDFVFGIFFNCQKKQIPNLEKRHAFLAESTLTLARKVRNGELKSEQLVQAVIERIKLVDPIINAVVEDRYEDALQEARDIDARLAKGIPSGELDKKPFLGIPFTTKESQASKGFRLTLGLWARRNERATEDSEAVKRMKDAGAILIATTNLPELLIWQETRNPVYGQTNNPHHSGRTPGGSSGAEAALTASYATTISLCSDIGGSTRMPAFYCGMFGHHPTANTTNIKGVLFRSGEEDSMFCLGFISRHVEDLAPLTKIIAGDKAPLLKLDRDVDVKDINFYFVESSNDCHVSSIRPDIKNAMTRVIQNISSKNPTASPQPYYHEALDHMYQLWNYWMAQEPDDFAILYTDKKFIPIWWKEIAKKLFCASQHCLSAVVRLAEVQFLPLVEKSWAVKITADFKKDLFSKLGDNGVLLFPSAPHAAPHHFSCFTRPYNFAYWACINVLKCPATQVPLGVNSQGLPIGIQVVASPYNDALCLSVAKYLEKEFGGAVFPCKRE